MQSNAYEQTLGCLVSHEKWQVSRNGSRIIGASEIIADSRSATFDGSCSVPVILSSSRSASSIAVRMPACFLALVFWIFRNDSARKIYRGGKRSG